MQQHTDRPQAMWWEGRLATGFVRDEDPGRMLLTALGLSAGVWIVLAGLLTALLR